MIITKTIRACRVCGSNKLVDILSLGNQCVTNFLDNPKEKIYKAPLVLVLCDPKFGGCGLLQLKHTFNHDILYRKYWYKSGISTMMVKALADVVKKGQQLIKLKANDIVIDIGSNDSTLLEQYKSNNIIKVGFEPSNLWNIKKGKNTIIFHNYFNKGDFVKKFGSKKAKIITSLAMFYDLEEPNVFVEDIKACLDNEGIWIIQMNYLGLMLENNTFDNISHEHLEYYSFSTLEYLLNKHKLVVCDVELNDVNGGSFRVYVKHANSKIKLSASAKKRLDIQRKYELKMGFNNPLIYHEFAKRIKKIKKELVAFLEKEVKRGKIIFIYGASTRGLVVLQFAGINIKLIKAAVDKNPDKLGKYIVGTGIPIISLEEYRKHEPDYLFVLPYHFISEILKQENRFMKDGGKMITAIPNVKIWSRE